MRGPVRGGVWCRETITDEHGGRWYVEAWAALRSGRLVLGALSLIPAPAAPPEGGTGTGRAPGEPWRPDPTEVPRFGLERRLLAKVPVGRFVPQVLAGLSEAAAYHADAGAGQQHQYVPRGMLLASHLLPLPGVAALVPRPRQRRNVGRDDDFYARLAAEYVQRIGAGSAAPVKDIAVRRQATAAHVRDLLHEARERGLLTRGTAGKSEGMLTRRALELLKERGRKTPRRRKRR